VKFWTKAEFKELEYKWYKKLKRNGFKDIELSLGNQRVIANPSKLRKDLYNSQEYYRQLKVNLVGGSYDCKADRVVMSLRTEGVPIKSISAKLGSLGLKSHRETIRKIIRKYETRWGVRKWPATK
jgi:hypothetical protein